MNGVVFLHGYFRAIPFQWLTGEVVVFIRGNLERLSGPFYGARLDRA